MKALTAIRGSELEDNRKLFPVLALTLVLIFLLCLNSYAGDAENLIDAVKQDDISTVKALLDKGADVNAKTVSGQTALMIASSMHGHLEAVQVLLSKGADVNAKDDFGQTALAYGSDDISTVKALLAKGADVNAKNMEGATALIAASWEGHFEIVQALLAKGADVNAKDNYGRTALMAASWKGHFEIVQALLAKGADVNAKDGDGHTALNKPEGEVHSDVAQMLIKAGAKEVKPRAISSLRIISTASESFRVASNPIKYPPSLKALSEANPPYIDLKLGSGSKDGYTYTYTFINANEYTCVATPEKPGKAEDKTYFVDETGVIRLDNASGNPVD